MKITIKEATYQKRKSFELKEVESFTEFLELCDELKEDPLKMLNFGLTMAQYKRAYDGTV